jgi:hypothetical protein
MSQPMSTPISNIPIQSQPQSPTEDDPEVLALLKELQPPVASTMSTSPPPPPQPRMPVPHSASSHYNINEGFVSKKPYFQPEVMQKTLVFVILAFIIFYPQIFDSVYQKMPSLEGFRTYEVVGRALLLFVITYGLQWKFLDR